jgi:hypothetical protein
MSRGDFMNVIENLSSRYGYDYPIFLKDIQEVNQEYSYGAVRQLALKLTHDNILRKHSHGVYYLPTVTALGVSVLDDKQVYERKYIKDNGKFIGYYTGLTLLNAIGLTTQVPSVIEIVSNNEPSRKRSVTVGTQSLILRKPHVTVTNENVYTLQILDLINLIDLKNVDIARLQSYIHDRNISIEDVNKYIGYYPSRVSKKLIESGIYETISR